jgi:hypothetical protein
VARLRDSDRREGFNYQETAEIKLTAQRSLAIDFRQKMGSFLFRW